MNIITINEWQLARRMLQTGVRLRCTATKESELLNNVAEELNKTLDAHCVYAAGETATYNYIFHCSTKHQLEEKQNKSHSKTTGQKKICINKLFIIAL